jgi:hypothetical protein
MSINNEIILTKIIIACIILVLSMLLKLKTAPERKKRNTQKLNSPTYFTSLKTFFMILPVIIHLETDVPNKYTEIEMHGK